ncbi:hypothetical protein PLICRDRAFT_39014 [Plicaturopsis crispa FD-325 SS-3]|nr:hypothetical protein PLICRDRAFT_39014 [Plicaturopsis crispa FD-325 SS-3]
MSAQNSNDQELHIRIENGKLFWTIANLEGSARESVAGSHEQSTIVGRPIRGPYSPGTFALFTGSAHGTVYLTLTPYDEGNVPVHWEGRGSPPGALQGDKTVDGHYTLKG